MASSLCDANDTAREPSSGVSSGQTLGVASLSQVILSLVDHKRTADNVVVAVKRDGRVLDLDFSDTIVVGLHVSQVSDVSNGILRCSVDLVRGVEVTASGCAPVSIVPEFVDMKSMEAWGETRDLASHGHSISLLLEGYGSSHALPLLGFQDTNGFG